MNKTVQVSTVNAARAYGELRRLKAATAFGNGAILIDEFDRAIFDDILRRYMLWNRIDMRLAPGETTGGFDQTLTQSARSAPVRNLGFSTTSPSREARTRRNIKSIVADLEFGIFDLSVYQQQGRRFGNLEEKDVNDMVTGCLRLWSALAYTGDVNMDADEFDGLRVLLGAGDTVDATTSIVNAIAAEIVSLMNTSAKDVQPTAIYTNSQIVFRIEQELLKIGNKLVYAPIQVGQGVFQVAQLNTPGGTLPLIADPFNTVIAGTPDVYPTYILSEDKLSWQYVEVLGEAGAEPKTFQLSDDTDLDRRFKTLQFGAMELLGGTNHHSRLNIEDRTTIVDPTA
jgi:hypothetical protein